MRTTPSQKFKDLFGGKKIVDFRKDKDALAVLRDVSNGKEYFLSIIDSFSYSGRDYVVMFNYEPDDGNHPVPELVIMRSEFTKSGNQSFYSIVDEKELDGAFAKFISRYASSFDAARSRS